MANLGFSVTTEHMDGTVVLRPSGELDVMTAPKLARVLEGAVSRCPVVVVDLSGVCFLDCAGLAPIRRVASQPMTDLRIIGARPKVDRVLRLTGVGRLLR